MQRQRMRVGMIGYRFMGKAHSRAFRDVGMFMQPRIEPVLQVISGRDEQALAEAQAQFGWAEADPSWERVVARPDIDIIDIATPSHLHRDIALAALAHGKHVLCEKPLANNVQEAKEMALAAARSGRCHMVGFNYRRIPAVQLAKKWIDEGKLGQIYHVRARYLQDWLVDPEFPLVWRLRREVAGSGSLGDLGSHLIDLARYLVGEFREVVALQETFIRERPLPAEAGGLRTGLAAEAGAGQRGTVTVDDATLFLARFASGAVGTFETSRMSPGRRNGEEIEISGSLGTLVFRLERLNELEFFSREDAPESQGFRTVLVTDRTHPYVRHWWPPGHILGWEHTFVHEVYEFLEGIADGTPRAPTFEDGWRCQQVLDAVERSAQERRWVTVPDEPLA